MSSPKPVEVPAGTVEADPNFRTVERAVVTAGMEWAIAPYCTCGTTGGASKSYADRGDGKYVATCCGRPSKEVYYFAGTRDVPADFEGRAFKPAAPHTRIDQPRPPEHAVGDEVEVGGIVFTKIAENPFDPWAPPVDTGEGDLVAAPADAVLPTVASYVSWTPEPPEGPDFADELAAHEADEEADRLAYEASVELCSATDLDPSTCAHCRGEDSPEIMAVATGSPYIDAVNAEIGDTFAAHRRALEAAAASPSPMAAPGATVGDPSPVEAAVGQGVKMKFSNSEIRKFKRCRRAWWLSYYRGLTPRREGVGPLSIGNMVHKPLEVYYGTPERDPEAFDWETPLAEHVEERLADPALPDNKHAEMLESYELAKIMLRGYFDYLVEEGVDSELIVLSPEREIEAYLDTMGGVEVWLIGKLDVEVEMKSDGRRAFIDHKSAANLTDLPKVGQKDEQFLQYGLLQRMEAVAEGRTDARFANGGVWNILRKVKRTASAKPPFYGRAGVTHNDQAYRSFQARVWGEIRDILATRANLDAGGLPQVEVYPNPTRDCSWDCPFVTICPQFDDGSDVEAVIATEFLVHDPYARYTDIEKG